MLSQDYDHAEQDDVSKHRDDPAGQLEVPTPRSPSAVRLLEMTARDTDQWRADAQAEAAHIVATARDEADALARSAQREVETMVEAARLEAARVVDEARATAGDVRTKSEEQRARVEAEVARLEQLAANHAQHLRRHLNGVLKELDSDSARPRPADTL
ncbi:hypothetical protein GCM10023339_33540 [Alloalcanivorax gelatiniphagus]